MLPIVNFDRELSRFIAAGRLHCKIDKVGEIVETNRPDSKNYQYQVWYAFFTCHHIYKSFLERFSQQDSILHL